MVPSERLPSEVPGEEDSGNEGAGLEALPSGSTLPPSHISPQSPLCSSHTRLLEVSRLHQHEPLPGPSLQLPSTCMRTAKCRARASTSLTPVLQSHPPEESALTTVSEAARRAPPSTPGAPPFTALVTF